MSETVTVSDDMGKQVASSNLVSKENDRICLQTLLKFENRVLKSVPTIKS